MSVCKTDEAQEHAYKLLQVLCDDPSCLARVVKIINEVFYENRTLDKVVWEYQPDYSLRQPGHFVGLKNGGATCYMNSILQQVRYFFTFFFENVVYILGNALFCSCI